MGTMIEDFLSFSISPAACGVYLLLYRGKVVYVGKSTNLFARIGQHYNNMLRVRKGLRPHYGPGVTSNKVTVRFDQVKFKPCAKEDLDKEEIRLIQEFLPSHNVMHNRPIAPVKLSLSNLRTFIRKPKSEEETKRGLWA